MTSAPRLPVVLVTGGAKRIGATLVRAFARARWHVVIHHRNSHAAAEALAATCPSAETVACDLSSVQSIDQLVSGLADRFNDWRVLINSAAVFNADQVEALDPETFDEALAVNARAPALLAQSFLRHARGTAGRTVINLTDQKLANPNPDFFSYTLSKHALAATIPMLAMGAAGPNDRVYGLAPGAILPSHDQTAEEADASHRLNLLRRRTGADEIADACLWLAEGWLASGETLFVDSGQHLLAQPRDVIYLAREGQVA